MIAARADNCPECLSRGRFLDFWQDGDTLHARYSCPEGHSWTTGWLLSALGEEMAA